MLSGSTVVRGVILCDLLVIESCIFLALFLRRCAPWVMAGNLTEVILRIVPAVRTHGSSVRIELRCAPGRARCPRRALPRRAHASHARAAYAQGAALLRGLTPPGRPRWCVVCHDGVARLMAPRLPALLAGRKLEARLALSLLGVQSAGIMYWSAPWRDDDNVTVGSFLRTLPVAGALISMFDSSTSSD